jgi:hypothetical protein
MKYTESKISPQSFRAPSHGARVGVSPTHAQHRPRVCLGRAFSAKPRTQRHLSARENYFTLQSRLSPKISMKYTQSKISPQSFGAPSHGARVGASPTRAQNRPRVCLGRAFSSKPRTQRHLSARDKYFSFLREQAFSSTQISPQIPQGFRAPGYGARVCAIPIQAHYT